MADSPKETSGGGNEELGQPESVGLLLSFLRDVAFADESERQRNLDTKAGTLAGFVVVALSLEVGLGASVLVEESLPCGARALFIAFLAVSVLALAASGLAALLGVLLPKDYLALEADQIMEMATRAEMQRPPNEVREMQLATMAQIVAEAQAADDQKAKQLRRASIALAVGLVAIAAQAFTLPFA
jgi:hypothetical protein